MGESLSSDSVVLLRLSVPNCYSSTPVSVVNDGLGMFRSCCNMHCTTLDSKMAHVHRSHAPQQECRLCMSVPVGPYTQHRHNTTAGCRFQIPTDAPNFSSIVHATTRLASTRARRVPEARQGAVFCNARTRSLLACQVQRLSFQGSASWPLQVGGNSRPADMT